MKSTSADARTLAVRCLNETRLLHPPTYVASRFLADSISSAGDSSWTSAAVRRRYPAQLTPRFFKFQRYKKRNEGNSIEYRNFLIPSPFTCLAEAFILDKISGLHGFRKADAVYSYRWPKSSKSPYNFEHYTNGYRKRNADIAAALADNPGCIAVVTDISQFYPSISHEVVRQRFQTRIEDLTGKSGERTTAQILFEHLIADFPHGKGIATGPELSHVIGDLALSEVDKEFGQRLPGRYFRYVDDIVFVTRPEEEKLINSILEDLLMGSGLRTNPHKRDTVSSVDWLTHSPDHSQTVNKYSFEALVFRLKVFLAAKPERAISLENALRDSGFCIPLSRIKEAAGSHIFKQRLKLFLSKGWWVASNALADTEKSIINFAIAVRNELKQQLFNLFELEFPTAATLRRWRVQRIRYLTNRSLYLLPLEELGLIGAALADHPEFAETNSIISFLRTDDYSDLLKMPGPAVSAAASIRRLFHRHRPKIILPDTLNEAETHSAGIFLLYGIAELQTNLNMSVKSDVSSFLLFCAGSSPQFRENSDFGYLDEIRTLQLGRRPEEHINMLETRFSENEAIAFEALEIGGEYFT